MKRLLLALCAFALALVIPAAPGLSVAPAPFSEDGQSDSRQRANEIASETADLQQDLYSLSEVQEAAKARLRAAQKAASDVAAELEHHRLAEADARELIGVYMRSIYMNGPNDLTMMASLIDSESPGDLVQRADEARRVGDHKDDQYDEAVALVARTEESKAASEAALGAARQSMAAIDDQVNGLRERRAIQASDLAKHVGVPGTLLDPEQIVRNGEAASAWAVYLGQLAKWKVPPVTVPQLRKGLLPEGMTASKKQPGVAVFRKGSRRISVLPERTIAAVTYAISRLGTAYKWQANSATEMDCSALVDRAWNVPGLSAQERDNPRALVPEGVRGIAKRTRLFDASSRKLGDVVFLADAKAGVNHAGIALMDDLMVAADPSSGAVNAIPIDDKRAWKVGRLALPERKRGNKIPPLGKKEFQCGADPDSFISLPDGKVLANPKLCPPSPVFGEAHLQTNTIQAGRCISALWPQIQTIGGWRPSDPYPDHPSGHAIDIMMPAGCDADPRNVAIGNQIATFLMTNAEKFDVKYMIWQQRIWTANGKPIPIAQWRGMSNRGGCTANHMDHVHLTTNGSAPAPGVPTPVKVKPDPEVEKAHKDDEKKSSAKGSGSSKKTPAKPVQEPDTGPGTNADAGSDDAGSGDAAAKTSGKSKNSNKNSNKNS